MVTRANTLSEGIGGHLSTYASSASLYEVGFNHFFRGKDDGALRRPGLLPGPRRARHLRPGLPRGPARPRSQLDHFRQEVGGRRPVVATRTPGCMPDFWEFPTVSMGLGPINAIYQARFNRYLLNREIADTSRGQGVVLPRRRRDATSPSRSARCSLAAREQLDNLIFVVNCNLQRLDGPVRGNGKIIQELEAVVPRRGLERHQGRSGARSGTSCWPRDIDGVLLNKMNTTVDGEFQKYAVESGAYIREHFFGPDPRLRKMVEHLTDDELRNAAPRRPRLPQALRRLQGRRRARGRADGDPGQDDQGLDARPRDRGPQRHPPDQEDDQGRSCRLLRDRLYLQEEIPDEALDDELPPYYRPADDSPELRVPDGAPARRSTAPCPERVVAARSRCRPRRRRRSTSSTAGSGKQGRCRRRWRFARLLRNLLRDKSIGKRVVPIIPDEARTFGMDALFQEVEDLRAVRPAVRAGRRRAAAVLPRGQGRPDPRGGHHRGGLDGSLHRRGHRVRHVGPADGAVLHLLFDVRLPAGRRPDLGRSATSAARGFLLGATAGRTTLNGEGLQHEDGHSHVLASTVPNCRRLRPGVRLRGGVDRPGRHPPHVRRRSPRTSSTTSPSTTRTT